MMRRAIANVRIAAGACRRAPRAVLVGTLAVALVGCAAARNDPGGGGGAGIGGSAATGNPAQALARWRDFPVTADPRPLVLTGGVVLDPQTGFATGDGKLAYLGGQFEQATTLPAGPSTSGGFAIVTAGQALDELRPAGSTPVAGSPAAGSRPNPDGRLRVVKASLVQATFGTDRGPRLLPAWRFDLEHVADPVRVLAVAKKARWSVGETAPTASDFQASVTGDGRTLNYGFFGTPAVPGPCGADYTGSAAESATAVVVTVRQVPPDSARNSSTQACPAIAAARSVVLHLAAPLGGRVLLTVDGAPIPVTSR